LLWKGFDNILQILWGWSREETELLASWMFIDLFKPCTERRWLSMIFVRSLHWSVRSKDEIDCLLVFAC
jgi:hypothetical protein